jgi:hypothetical protein
MPKRKEKIKEAEVDSASSVNELAVRTLHCPNCGATVPPTGAETAECPRCDASIQVPPDYRAAREAELSHTAGREEAERLFKRLGRPPGLLLRIWGKVAGPAIFFLWPLVLTIEALFLIKWLDKIGRYFNANLSETLRPSEFWALLAAVLYVTLAVPLIVGIYGKRRTKARRLLQAALSAKPPSKPGGLSRCRACGARLKVETGALGATCAYCEADNLMAIPESWIGELRGHTKSLGKSIEEAAAEDAKMRRRWRRSMIVQLSVLFLLVPLLYFFGKADDGNRSRMPPDWKTAMETGARIVSFDPRFWPSYLRVRGCELPECSYKSSFVALRYNDTVQTVNLGRFPPEIEGLLIEHSASSDPLFGYPWEEVGESQLIMPPARRTVEFRAPRSGWYKIDVMCTYASADCKQVLHNTNHVIVNPGQ